MAYLLPLLLLLATAHAAAPPRASRQSIKLFRRVQPNTRSPDEARAWAEMTRLTLLAKYGPPVTKEKRSTGTTLLTDADMDSSYSALIKFGTPPTEGTIILDTGSADLVVKDSTFNGSMSSTIKELNMPFNISYGGGSVSGRLVNDTVELGGFTVLNQTFAPCNNVTPADLFKSGKGIMGLAFQGVASSKATPFWLMSLAEWDSPLMAFQLTRFRNVTDAKPLEPGGSFTMGYVNETLFTGDIDYHDTPTGREAFWTQQLTNITIQGTPIPLPSGPESYAAIDTGTTLIAAPNDTVEAIFKQINGSRPGTGEFEGFHFYPCNTNVSVTMAFGGKSWPITNDDFQATRFNDSDCLGAFFTVPSITNPAWIIGDSFLKSVYSVYRYDPPSVGFAELSPYALSLNDVESSDPTSTTGSVSATESATRSNYAWHIRAKTTLIVMIPMTIALFLL